MTGTLYVCATPIGNLEDMTPRAIRILKEADLIAAEDTRNSKKLLNHFEIHTPLTSYHEYNRVEKAHALTERLLAGENIALITDAGTPGISDPGQVIVRFCLEKGIPVRGVPGASALAAAISVSGQESKRFVFEAFLPKEKKEYRERIEALKTEERTIVLYEAPHRLRETVKELLAVWGDRELTLCRELTKIHEEIVLTTLSDVVSYYEDREPRGEYVLVVCGRSREEGEEEKRSKYRDVSLTEHLAMYEEQGMDRKEAMKAVATDRGIPKREVYKGLLEEKEENE